MIKVTEHWTSADDVITWWWLNVNVVMSEVSWVTMTTDWPAGRVIRWWRSQRLHRAARWFLIGWDETRWSCPAGTEGRGQRSGRPCRYCHRTPKAESQNSLNQPKQQTKHPETCFTDSDRNVLLEPERTSLKNTNTAAAWMLNFDLKHTGRFKADGLIKGGCFLPGWRRWRCCTGCCSQAPPSGRHCGSHLETESSSSERQTQEHLVLRTGVTNQRLQDIKQVEAPCCRLACGSVNATLSLRPSRHQEDQHRSEDINTFLWCSLRPWQ